MHLHCVWVGVGRGLVWYGVGTKNRIAAPMEHGIGNIYAKRVLRLGFFFVFLIKCAIIVCARLNVEIRA